MHRKGKYKRRHKIPWIKSRNARYKRNLKLRLLIKQRNKCFYCSIEFIRPELSSFDHVIPKSKGGTFSVDNLVLACFKCNEEKADDLW